MFLQQQANPWVIFQRGTQVTMILLALAMLVIPILTQPQEAEAEGLTVCIVGGCFLIAAAVAGVCASCYILRCHGYCGRWGIGTGHERTCKAGHPWYWCYPNAGWHHAACTSS